MCERVSAEANGRNYDYWHTYACALVRQQRHAADCAAVQASCARAQHLCPSSETLRARVCVASLVAAASAPFLPPSFPAVCAASGETPRALTPACARCAGAGTPASGALAREQRRGTARAYHARLLPHAECAALAASSHPPQVRARVAGWRSTEHTRSNARHRSSAIHKNPYTLPRCFCLCCRSRHGVACRAC
jgi:hypothetical protein